MIIIGYQGIGKSTLANKNLKYIDLESGNFWINGKRDENWYKSYCNIAEHLSNQGYIVFVSSHQVVRNELKNRQIQVKCCIPSLKLKNEWIIKLENRFKFSKLQKDYKALMNAKDRYTENITEIIKSDFDTIIIDNINYNLEELISQEINNAE